MPYTLKDIEALPEGIRAELWDGELYYMEQPGTLHELIAGDLLFVLANRIHEKKLSYEVLTSNVAVFIEENLLLPDVKVISRECGEDGCYGGLDFVIEVLPTIPPRRLMPTGDGITFYSIDYPESNSKRRDMVEKVYWYFKSGVKEYWIVDPRERKVYVHVFEGEYGYRQYDFGEDIPVGIWEGFRINLEELGFDEEKCERYLGFKERNQ